MVNNQEQNIPVITTQLEGQLGDAELIDHHNTTEESDRICHEYSAYFEKVKDQEYSPYHSTTPGVEHQIPEPDYYNTDTQPNSTRNIKIQMYISLPFHLLKIYVHGMVEDVEEPGI